MIITAHVVLRALSAACTLKGSYSVPVQAIEITAFQSNEPDKAELEVNDWS